MSTSHFTYHPCMLEYSEYTKKDRLQVLSSIDCSDTNAAKVLYDISLGDDWYDKGTSLVKQDKPEEDKSENFVEVLSYTKDAYEIIRENYDWYYHRENIGLFINFDEFKETSPRLRYLFSSIGCVDNCNDKNNCSGCDLYNKLIDYGKQLSINYLKSDEYKLKQKDRVDFLNQFLPSIENDVLQYSIGEYLYGKITDINSVPPVLEEEEKKEEEEQKKKEEKKDEEEKKEEVSDYLLLDNSKFEWSLISEFKDGTTSQCPIQSYLRRSAANYYGVFIEINDTTVDKDLSHFYLRFGLKNKPIDFYTSEHFYPDRTIISRVNEIYNSIRSVRWPQDS